MCACASVYIYLRIREPYFLLHWFPKDPPPPLLHPFTLPIRTGGALHGLVQLGAPALSALQFAARDVRVSVFLSPRRLPVRVCACVHACVCACMRGSAYVCVHSSSPLTS